MAISQRVHNAVKNYYVHRTFILVLYFTKDSNSIHILVIVDTWTNYAVTEYQHEWSKYLNIHCSSEAQFFKRETENFVHQVNILIFIKP